MKRRRAVTLHAERPHWVDDPANPLDPEMKRQLALKDKPKEKNNGNAR